MSGQQKADFLTSLTIFGKECFLISRKMQRRKGFIDFINGYLDHVHCLISLGTDQTLEKLMQLIKGEASFWINKNKLTKTRFEWQDEYFVVGVNEGSVNRVRDYIARQEDHKTVTFDDEFENFLIRAGFQRFKDV